ncbi:MAG: FtsQ-type POTRA domain-containing protein [Actinomycetota bacterium]
MTERDDRGNFEIPVEEPTEGLVDADIEAELAAAFDGSGRVHIVDESVANRAATAPEVDGDPTGRWSRLRRRVTRDPEEAAELRQAEIERRDERRAEVEAKRVESRRVEANQVESGRARTKVTEESATKARTANRRDDPAVSSPRGERRRVVIKDDTEAPAKLSGEARFRQRRLAVRRQEGRRRLWWLIVAGSAVVAILVVLLLLTSPILSVRKVTLEGVVYADPERVGEVVASLKGDPILTADLQGAAESLEAIPWVEKARVSMHLPSQVHIEIVERQPIGFYRAVDGFNRVIDLDGRVLDVIEGDLVDYPFIGGTGPNLSAGDLVGQPFLGAAQLINALPRDLRVRLVTAAVTPDGEVSLALTDEVDVLFGRPEGFQEKLVALVNAIKREGSARYSVIDVSSGEASVR